MGVYKVELLHEGVFAIDPDWAVQWVENAVRKGAPMVWTVTDLADGKITDVARGGEEK